MKTYRNTFPLFKGKIQGAMAYFIGLDFSKPVTLEKVSVVPRGKRGYKSR